MYKISYKIFILLIILSFVLLPGFIYPQENYEVTGISFEGNMTLDAETLSNTIVLSSTGWFSKNILRNEPVLFNSEILSADLGNITKLYQREGFLFAKVNTKLIIDNDKKTVNIIIIIDEGTPIIVDSTNIKINETAIEYKLSLDSLLSSISQDLILTKGERFRDDDLREDETKLITFFLNDGYPHVKINPNLNVDTINCLVSINWNISIGPLSKFGNTFIDGLKYYSKSLIRSKLDYSHGEIYNAEILNVTQVRLFDLGIFYGVDFKSILTSDSINIIPVKLKLTEAKRLKTTLGVGYGRDEKFRISLKLILFGILKGPGRINFEAKKSAIEEFSFKLGYSHPEFLWKKTTFSLNTFTTKVNELAYRQNTKGFNIGILNSFSKILFASVTYGLMNINLDVSSIAAQNDSSQLKDKYNKSGINILVRHDNAEPYILPKKGYNISISATYSGIGLSSPYKFFKSIIDFRSYHSIVNSLAMGLKISIGYLKSFNRPEFIPVEERFYLGGSNSVRGWERFKLGPSDSNGIPKGGSSYLEGSIEFRYPTLERIYGVIFWDYGNVWELPFTYKINELQHAAGVGIRYSTPVGPLRLDIATPIFNESKNIQFWFSIGHAF